MLPVAAQTEDGTAYEVAGAGDCVLMLHGLGLDRHMWSAQRDALADTWRVVMPDLAGHGESPPAGGTLALADLVRQVSALLDHVGESPVHVVGFGLGGWVGIALASAEPERVRSLFTVSTAFRRLKSQSDLLRARIAQAKRHGPAANADGTIQRWFSAAFQVSERALVDAVHRRLTANTPAGYLAAAELALQADAEVVELSRAVHCPAMVLSGALDGAVTPAMSRQLAASMGAARHHVAPRQRHMMPIESASLVNKMLREWLAAPGPA